MPLLPRSGIGANLKSKLGRVSPKNLFPRLISILGNFLTICKGVLYLLLKFDHLPLRLPLLVEELLLLLLQPPPDPLLVLHDPVQRVPLLPTHPLALRPLSVWGEKSLHVAEVRAAEYFPERAKLVLSRQSEAFPTYCPAITRAASRPTSLADILEAVKIWKKVFVSNYVELLTSGRRRGGLELISWLTSSQARQHQSRISGQL